MRAKEFIKEAIPLDQLRAASGPESQDSKDLTARLSQRMSSKPRNFVSKNAKMGGAGAHKDKKRAVKQGDVKHKGKAMAEAGSPAQQAAIAINMKKHHKKPKHEDVDEDISRRGFLRGAGAALGGAALGGVAQASEQPDPNKLIARVSMAGDTKEFDLTGRFKGDAKSQLNQASDWLSEFLEAREIDFSDFELRYQGKLLKTKNTAANLGMLNR